MHLAEALKSVGQLPSVLGGFRSVRLQGASHACRLRPRHYWDASASYASCHLHHAYGGVRG
jgi:hypothetical protein